MEKNFSDILEEGKYFAKNIFGLDLKNSYEYPISKQSISNYPKQLKKKILNELKFKKRNFTAKNFQEFVEGQVGKLLQKCFLKDILKSLGFKNKGINSRLGSKKNHNYRKNRAFFSKTIYSCK